ncbi:cupin domain-containing protein [Cyclobacterium xiamenense]|uniref:cupin domain-containing protein n=1 Tax=Cyclobacterium xiamenense TaxID=1297121 RepID=UPI0012B87BF0|nr:cupin domain-containing protein [Cyclobacterium xiamenense]
MDYPFQLPKTIRNPFGEALTFQKRDVEQGVEKLLVSNTVPPNAGPPFHVHFKQEESLTVIRGKMGYQVHGEAEQFVSVGETVRFPAGQMHRFWNPGPDELLCEGWVKPANTLDFFLAATYQSMQKAGKPEGDLFDSAYLTTRYASEYDLPSIPFFVKKVLMPLTVLMGKALNKYAHFQHAPEPMK